MSGPRIGALGLMLAVSGCQQLAVDGALVIPALPEDTRSSRGPGDVDHTPLDTLLATLVDGDCVHLSMLFDPSDLRGSLDDYLGTIASVQANGTGTATERIAFWINAYNAITLGTLAAATEADPSFSTAGTHHDEFSFFSLDRHPVAGYRMTLDEIEHGILRGARAGSSLLDSLHADLGTANGTDPRIHAALNCGAKSCPPLAPFAFGGEALDAQLADRARAWVNDPVRGAGPQGISSLFQWYAVDFEHIPGGVETFVTERFEGDLSTVNFERFLPYDWSNNQCPQ